MASLRPAAHGRDTPGIGDEDGGMMNEGDMDYSQEQNGLAEIRDHTGQSYCIPMDLLASVGVDIDSPNPEITEEQMNMLLTMTGQRDDDMASGPIKEEYQQEGPTSDQLTISILNDGGVKLVNGAEGHESFFSSSQLAEVGIDTRNLSDDDIKRIVQFASAGEVIYDDTMERPAKQRKLDNGVAAGGIGRMEERREAAGRMQPMQRSYRGMHASSHSGLASTSAGLVQGGPGSSLGGQRMLLNGVRPRPYLNSSRQDLIGESVKIQNSKGKIVNAIVRYQRPGTGIHSAAYKVQTADGKFEWIAPERIIDRSPREVQLQPQQQLQQRDYDHKAYTSSPPPAMHHTPAASASAAAAPSTSSGAPLTQYRRVLVGSSGQRTVRQYPLLQPTQQLQQQLQHTGHPSSMQQQQQEQKPHPPNFCCPVCDRKVYQKEPAYIVIRLPACDSCTRERILIVDEAGKGGGDEEEGSSTSTPAAAAAAAPPTAPARPQMRSIATDTEDLAEMSMRAEEKANSDPRSTAASPEDEDEEEEEENEQHRRQSAAAAAASSATPSEEMAEEREGRSGYEEREGRSGDEERSVEETDSGSSLEENEEKLLAPHSLNLPQQVPLS